MSKKPTLIFYLFLLGTVGTAWAFKTINRKSGPESSVSKSSSVEMRIKSQSISQPGDTERLTVKALYKSVSGNLYEAAFEELDEMANGRIEADFKRAVFITENAYYKGALNYQDFCAEISAIADKLQALIKDKGIAGYKTAGNWAAFTYMIDSIPENNFRPDKYDFDDFMGDKDWTKMFVTKLMRTKTGNCHSLPYKYKILCEEIGASAYLAFAPNHVYIKHKDENGVWTNVELTNGGFPRDQWMIRQMGITVEAIKNEVYMNPLSQEESIAQCMFDLAQAYNFQYGNDAFTGKVIDTALKHFPKNINLLLQKANWYRDIGQAESKKKKPDMELITGNYTAYQKIIDQIDSLGYKDMPIELYQDWVRTVENEKAKRTITSKND